MVEMAAALVGKVVASAARAATAEEEAERRLEDMAAASMVAGS